MPRKLSLPVASEKPSIDAARKRLGGRLDTEPPPPGLAPGCFVAVGGQPVVVLYAGERELHVLFDAVRLRRLQSTQIEPFAGDPGVELEKLAADARLFGQLVEGQGIRYADGAGRLLDAKLIEKCRWGAIVAREDGAVVAVGFRKLWPAAKADA